MIFDRNDPLAVADHSIIMRRTGYFVGYYGQVSYEDTVSDMKKRLGSHLGRVKGAYVTIYHHHLGSDLLDEMVNGIGILLGEDVSVVFSEEVDETIPSGNVAYEVLLSGVDVLTGIEV